MPDKLTDNLSNNSPILANELSDSEIKKALECCSSGSYGCENGCPLDEECDSPIRGGEKIMKSALDLINRLQAEKEKAWELFKKRTDEKTELQMICDKQKSEIEMLQSHIQEGIDLAKQIPEMLALTKAEAYKECIEKILGMNISELDDYVEIERVRLDNLLNELVGEDKVQWSKQGECPITPEQFNAIYEDNSEDESDES